MIEQAILGYAVNSIWQVPMLAAVAWLVIWLGRPGVRAQHSIWLATLALAVLLPLRGIGGVGIVATRTKSAARSGATQLSVVAMNNQPVGPHALAARDGQKHAVWLRDMPRLPMRTIRLSQWAAYWLMGLYFFAAFFRLVQLVSARRAARTLARGARKAVLSPSVTVMLARLCEKFGVREPQVRMSSAVVSPVTMGVVRPVLLLPETFAENSENEITAVLCHELAHVWRRDYLVNLLCQVGALPIAYHPATHAMQQRVRQTREMVCDAMAADAMRSTSGYARCLVVLAQRMLGGRAVAEQVQAVGLFDNSVLEERVMRLLEAKTKMSTQARVARVATGAVLMAAVMATTAIFHLTPTVVKAAQVNARPAAVTANNRGNTGAGAMQKPVPTPAVQPAAQVAPALPRKDGQVHPRPTGNQHGIVIQDGLYRDLTPEERARLQKELDRATAQVQEETRKLQSPEFKQQMAEMQQQIAEATKKMQSDAVQRQMRMLQSPEFKKQMADMQQQIAEETKTIQSAEVQRQMQMLQSPEFKKQMADMKQQIAVATKALQSAEVQRQLKMLQSSEFKQQMEEMQQKIQEQMQKLQSPEYKKQRETPQPLLH